MGKGPEASENVVISGNRRKNGWSLERKGTEGQARKLEI